MVGITNPIHNLKAVLAHHLSQSFSFFVVRLIQKRRLRATSKVKIVRGSSTFAHGSSPEEAAVIPGCCPALESNLIEINPFLRAFHKIHDNWCVIKLIVGSCRRWQLGGIGGVVVVVGGVGDGGGDDGATRPVPVRQCAAVVGADTPHAGEGGVDADAHIHLALELLQDPKRHGLLIHHLDRTRARRLGEHRLQCVVRVGSCLACGGLCHSGSFGSSSLRHLRMVEAYVFFQRRPCHLQLCSGLLLFCDGLCVLLLGFRICL